MTILTTIDTRKTTMENSLILSGKDKDYISLKNNTYFNLQATYEKRRRNYISKLKRKKSDNYTTQRY